VTEIEHEGFELDETEGGLWRCVHSKTRIAGVGQSREAAKIACVESLNAAVPEIIEHDDTTPIENPSAHDPTQEDG
jgi:hypothetical protein